ncbi:hypothetical protein KCU95_g16917, partial [Aureobasidium melanogenum]
MVLFANHRASNGQNEQLRTARTTVQSKVRNDWAFPDVQVLHAPQPVATIPVASTSATPNARDRVNEHIRQNNIVLPRDPVPTEEATEWRPRYYSDGEDSASDNDDNHTPPAYDTPDSVGRDLEARKERRRRRRQQRFENEMKENIGLAHWSAQRNKWTGAQDRTRLAQQNSSAAKLSPEQPQSPQTQSPAHTTFSSTLTEAIPDTDLSIPVAPPLLPGDPIRDRINEKAYSDIYTKVILQGRTPSIPISLTDVTRSLVHGWKEEGQWPPKPTPAEPSLVKKNSHPHFKGVLKQLGRPFLKAQGVPVEKGATQEFEVNARKPKYLPLRNVRPDVKKIPMHVAIAKLNHLALFLQEPSYQRSHEDFQAFTQRLDNPLPQGKRETDAVWKIRLAARRKQRYESEVQFEARMKAHHARVIIDTGPLFDEDEEWETIKLRALDYSRKLHITPDRVRQGFQEGGEYDWRWSWERALLWHFDPIDKRKRDIAVNKEISRYANFGACG